MELIDSQNSSPSSEQAFTRVAFASDLGMAPGVWPERITADQSQIGGNGQPFLRDSYEVRDGDVLAVTYRQLLGILRIRIFND